MRYHVANSLEIVGEWVFFWRKMFSTEISFSSCPTTIKVTIKSSFVQVLRIAINQSINDSAQSPKLLISWFVKEQWKMQKKYTDKYF